MYKEECRNLRVRILKKDEVSNPRTTRIYERPNRSTSKFLKGRVGVDFFVRADDISGSKQDDPKAESGRSYLLFRV